MIALATWNAKDNDDSPVFVKQKNEYIEKGDNEF